MTRALAGSALSLCILVAAGAAPALACDTRERAASASDRLRGPAPWAIGDSTAILATPLLARLGVDADAKGCRQFDEGIAMVARRGRRGPNAVVLALGANAGVARTQIARARAVLGRSRFLVLVTPRNYASARAAMLAAQRAHPDRVLTLDWTARSNAHQSWFFGDGLHVSHTGARAWARMIREALAPFFGPPRRGRPLGLPGSEDARGATACGHVRAYGRRTEVFVTRGAGEIGCRPARRLMRRPRLRPPAGWRFYDWRRVGRGPWTDVLARRDRSTVIAGITR